MMKTELTLELRPFSRNGMYTLISLRGTMETVAQPREVRSLLKILSQWSGAPVDVALCVDGTNAGSCWLELWDDVMKRIRGRHLFQLRFPITRETLTLTVDSGDDRR